MGDRRGSPVPGTIPDPSQPHIPSPPLAAILSTLNYQLSMPFPAALLEECLHSPLDVLDILLGALDAHLDSPYGVNWRTLNMINKLRTSILLVFVGFGALAVRARRVVAGSPLRVFARRGHGASSHRPRGGVGKRRGRC